jgi:GntR family transcriptional regulator
MTVDKAGFEFRLTPSSGVPPYLQLVQQVEHALRTGQLRPGDRLPLTREVVASLAINPNTVLKAYRQLELQGITEGRPGVGTFIVAAPSVGVLPARPALQRRLRQWVASAAGDGLDEQAMRDMFEQALRDVREEGVA